jgi:hypothetical protein
MQILDVTKLQQQISQCHVTGHPERALLRSQGDMDPTQVHRSLQRICERKLGPWHMISAVHREEGKEPCEKT